MEFCYRRNLPHWRQDQVTYFVTWRFGRGREDLVACNVDNDSDLSSRNEGGRPPPNLPLVRGRDFRRYRFQCYSPLDASERDLVVAGIKSFDVQRYQIAAYVVMDDHVHVLLRPFAGYELKAILHSWKSFTARQMQREHKRFGRIWQDESFDRIVRDDEEFAPKLDYIVGNPWKCRPEIGDYPWVWPLDR